MYFEGLYCSCCGIYERTRIIKVEVDDSIRTVKSCDSCYNDVLLYLNDCASEYKLIDEYGLRILCKIDREFEYHMMMLTKIGLAYRFKYEAALRNNLPVKVVDIIMSMLTPEIFVHRGGAYSN